MKPAHDVMNRSTAMERKCHFPTWCFPIRLSNLDTYIKHLKQKETRQTIEGEDRREVKAKKKEKPEDQPNESSRLPLFQHLIPVVSSLSSSEKGRFQQAYPGTQKKNKEKVPARTIGDDPIRHPQSATKEETGEGV